MPTNPFKKPEELEAEINDFLKKHKSYLSNQAKRLCDFFEMSCYNLVVEYYVNQGYKVQIENLKVNRFHYKLSPKGYPSNFSFFTASKTIKTEKGELKYKFEIHHNVTIQSAQDPDIYLTPDISVINADSIITEDNHYLVPNSKLKYCYVPNKEFLTFCEVKQYTPFPELLFSFSGLYGELIEKNNVDFIDSIQHIAPSLMLSGLGNLHTNKIKESLEKREPMNIVFDLFYSGKFNYTKNGVAGLNTIFSKLTSIGELVVLNKVDKEIRDEDLPF